MTKIYNTRYGTRDTGFEILRKVQDLRKDFPIAQTTHYLDTAAMALKPQQVINNVQEYMRTKSVNTNRGTYTLGEEATTLYEETRKTTAKFINAQQEEIIFNSGTTMGINTLSYSLQPLLKKGDTILSTAFSLYVNSPFFTDCEIALPTK